MHLPNFGRTASFVARALVRTGARVALAPLPLIHRDLDSYTEEKSARVTVQVRGQAGNASACCACPGFDRRRQPITMQPPAWPSWSLARLLPRDSPLKMRFTVIDAAPKPTLTPLTARAPRCACSARTSTRKWRVAAVCVRRDVWSGEMFAIA